MKLWLEIPAHLLKLVAVDLFWLTFVIYTAFTDFSMPNQMRELSGVHFTATIWLDVTNGFDLLSSKVYHKPLHCKHWCIGVQYIWLLCCFFWVRFSVKPLYPLTPFQLKQIHNNSSLGIRLHIRVQRSILEELNRCAVNIHILSHICKPIFKQIYEHYNKLLTILLTFNQWMAQQILSRH